MNQMEQLFGELLELSPAQRKQRLIELGAESPELEVQLSELIRAHHQAGSFLRETSQATVNFDGEENVGKQIRNYKLRELIGEGGMGAVYVAEQEKPIRRKVALKVIKPGMDSTAVLARFAAERNALALMSHPNIAKILDAGTTPEGRPYFVMELVNGQPITEYCDTQKLSIRQRLDLFIEVCNGIQHAHQKGIIHRDIKPSNVLVTELDGKPVAKVIDFGVSKALNQSLTEHSIYTAFQAVIGTPLYMSPEQASFSAVDVDTRSDVYSLGVLLYQLLTGTTPFSSEDLKQAAQDEVFRLIREQDPPRPSNRISSLGDTASHISQLRRTQPQQLGRAVKGDLDWIVMKALSKERGRRYDSAARFGEDVENYLRNHVVNARPPTVRYQIRKLYSRNKQTAALLAVVAIAFMTIVGMFIRNFYVQKALVAKLNAQNRQLVDSRFSQVFEYAQSGRLAEAHDELKRLKEASVDTFRLRLSDDIVKLFGNERERHAARDDLIDLDREHPNDTLVKSMLVLSYMHTNEEWSYWDHIAELHELKPIAFEDYLFRGAAFVFGQPRDARRDLETAIHMRPSSGVSHALLAQALQSEAMGYLCDPQEYLQLARYAYKESVVGVETSRSNNVNAAVASLDAHSTLYLALRRSKAGDLAQDCLRRWKSEINRCLSLLTADYDPLLHRALIDSYRLLLRNNESFARVIEGRVLVDPPIKQGVGETVIKLIQIYFARNESKKSVQLARAHLGRIRDYDSTALLPIVHAIHQAEGKSKAREYVRRELAGQQKHPVASAMNWVLLTLMQETERAQSEGREFREYCEQFTKVIPEAHGSVLVGRWMAGEATTFEFDSYLRASKDNDPRTLGLYRKAVYLLVVGKIEDAKRLFEEVRDSPNFRYFRNGWSEVFLARLGDPDFLPWLSK